jgi:sensor histidine kinase regulating citrate/malate metabolism
MKMHGVQPICVYEKLRCRFFKCCLILHVFFTNVVLSVILCTFLFTHITEMEETQEQQTNLSQAQSRMSKTQVVN